MKIVMQVLKESRVTFDNDNPNPFNNNHVASYNT